MKDQSLFDYRKKGNQVILYSYIDYRKFLKDYYFEKKENNHKFSYQSWAVELDLNQRSFLQNIISGRMKVPKEFISVLSQYFNFDKSEARYFRLICDWADEKDDKQRENLWLEVLKFNSKNLKMESDLMSIYLAKWYIPAIKEIILVTQSFQLKVVRDALNFQMKGEEVQYAIEFLKTKEIIKEIDGKLIDQVEKVSIRNESPEDQVVIKRYHEKLLDLSKTAMHELPSEKRNINATTFTVDRETYNLIEIRMKEIVDLILNADPEGDQEIVAQLNMQLFQLGEEK